MNQEELNTKELLNEIEKLSSNVQQLTLHLNAVSNQLKLKDINNDSSSSSYSVGDEVVIIHRNFQKQFGIQGKIYKTSKHYVWLRDNNNKSYQKQKSKIASLANYNAGRF
jgi:RNase P/RNase MRP subunit p29